MSVIGVVLKEAYLDDNRKVYYLHEDIRRYIQRKGFDIEVITPKSNINNMIEYLSGIVYQDDADLNNSIPSICITNLDNLNIYDNFFDELVDKNVKYNKSSKTIGITCRYRVLDNIGPVTYVTDVILNTFNLNVRIIIPIQDICYPTTSTSDFVDFSDEEKLKINEEIDKVDGLLFPGGYKFTPFDRYILDYAYLKDIPTLGICLGMQLISCFRKEVELLPCNSSINHSQDDDNILTHYVNIKKNSILYDIMGTDKIRVNSFHKMMATPNPNVEVIAYSEDGIIEGIVIPDRKFILGVQFHPEISYHIDTFSKKLIDYFENIVKN